MNSLELNKSLAVVIKAHRLKKGLTQAELATKLGYDTPQFVSIIERGLAKVPLNVVGQLIVILDIPERKLIKLLTASCEAGIKEEINQGKSKAYAG